MAWWFTRRAERELDDEIAAHLELAIRDLIARGETPTRAEEIARRQFGNVTAIREAGRDAGGSPLLERAVQDVRHALRRLRAQPGAAALAIAMLALGAVIAVALGRLLASIQYGVGAIDPLTWLGSIALVTIAAIVATIRPGRLAMRVDSVALLRRD